MKEFDQNKYSNDFLFFSYFGFTSDDIEKEDIHEVIKKCADRAYLDLNRTLKVKDKKTEAKEVREQISDKLSEWINDWILNEYEKPGYDYDRQHSKICRDICRDICSCKEIIFTYGQAQKWLNMTMKYLVVIHAITDIKLIKMLHIPVDSYILQAAWEEEDSGEDYTKKKIKFPLTERQRKDGKSGEFSDDKVVAWSKWDFNGDQSKECKEYKDFQESIKDYLGDKEFPLQWEGCAWIKVAKKRNK